MNVSTIGETNDFPAFYTRVSGFKVSSHSRSGNDTNEFQADWPDDRVLTLFGLRKKPPNCFVSSDHAIWNPRCPPLIIHSSFSCSQTPRCTSCLRLCAPLSSLRRPSRRNTKHKVPKSRKPSNRPSGRVSNRASIRGARRLRLGC